MNLRIKELAKQSGLIQYDTDSKMNDVEKFAELIVRECGNYLMSDEFIGRSDLDWSIILNDRFGVK
jgi:hypothetical protein